jgi:hypothetical protein
LRLFIIPYGVQRPITLYIPFDLIDNGDKQMAQTKRTLKVYMGYKNFVFQLENDPRTFYVTEATENPEKFSVRVYINNEPREQWVAYLDTYYARDIYELLANFLLNPERYLFAWTGELHDIGKIEIIRD